MILNKLSVKFQFTYKNTPSVFRWGILFAISVCFSDRRGRRSLQNNFIILRRGDSRIARFLFNVYRKTKSLYVILSAGRRVRPPTEVEVFVREWAAGDDPSKNRGANATKGYGLESRWLAIVDVTFHQKATKVLNHIPAALWRLGFSSLLARKNFDKLRMTGWLFGLQ